MRRLIGRLLLWFQEPLLREREARERADREREFMARRRAGSRFGAAFRE